MQVLNENEEEIVILADEDKTESPPLSHRSHGETAKLLPKKWGGFCGSVLICLIVHLKCKGLDFV
jgi:hypothetical protein